MDSRRFRRIPATDSRGSGIYRPEASARRRRERTPGGARTDPNCASRPPRVESVTGSQDGGRRPRRFPGSPHQVPLGHRSPLRRHRKVDQARRNHPCRIVDDLYKAGTNDKSTMRRFDKVCLTSLRPVAPEDIRASAKKSTSNELSVGSRRSRRSGQRRAFPRLKLPSDGQSGTLGFVGSRSRSRALRLVRIRTAIAAFVRRSFSIAALL
jgi:hypothetical protein